MYAYENVGIILPFTMPILHEVITMMYMEPDTGSSNAPGPSSGPAFEPAAGHNPTQSVQGKKQIIVGEDHTDAQLDSLYGTLPNEEKLKGRRQKVCLQLSQDRPKSLYNKYPATEN